MKRHFENIIDKQIVEAALLDHPSVDDCVVLVREAETSRRELVAYVVSAGPFSLERLQSHLQALLPTTILPSAYIPVSTLPLTDLGQVDEQALADLEVIDSDLVQRWEERLRTVPEVEQVAMVVQEYTERVPPLHLSDILPEWKTALASALEEPIVTPVEIKHSCIKNSDLPTSDLRECFTRTEPKALAISYGGPLHEEQGLPTTLSAALRRTAIQAPEKGIVYVQSNGSEIVQSYTALQEKAERILGGLRNLGLKPQDKVIFQLDLNQDFVPAYWGCILGGFVPVPISVPPTYQELNSTVSKLYHAWQMLEKPLILTSERQIRAIHSLSDLLGCEKFQVATINDLRSCEPDQNWHVSQPDDLAALFLTSGSTGVPKGVMLSHRNILSSVVNVAQMNGFSSLDVSFNWMPLDHVGSLVRCLTRDVYLGCVSIHAPTETVLQNPLLWLDWIEHYRATVTSTLR